MFVIQHLVVGVCLKIMQMAPGWPDWCKTDSDNEKYTTNYMLREGIHMERENLEKIPGM